MPQLSIKYPLLRLRRRGGEGAATRSGAGFYDATARAIIFAGINDARALPDSGSGDDPYAVFGGVPASGNPPDDWPARRVPQRPLHRSVVVFGPGIGQQFRLGDDLFRGVRLFVGRVAVAGQQHLDHRHHPGA